jgi:hypothetical protein
MSLGDFWVYLMYTAAISYFGLGVVITIGGWFDMWKMLRRLSQEANS